MDDARYLRERQLAPPRWIVLNLHMGTLPFVQSSLVSLHRRRSKCGYWDVVKKYDKLA